MSVFLTYVNSVQCPLVYHSVEDQWSNLTLKYPFKNVQILNTSKLYIQISVYPDKMGK